MGGYLYYSPTRGCDSSKTVHPLLAQGPLPKLPSAQPLFLLQCSLVQNGNTPLIIAASHNLAEVVDALLAKGADCLCATWVCWDLWYPVTLNSDPSSCPTPVALHNTLCITLPTIRFPPPMEQLAHAAHGAVSIYSFIPYCRWLSRDEHTSSDPYTMLHCFPVC